MLPRAVSSLLLLLPALSVFPLSAYSQLISSEIYETEEDLREGLEKGYLTLDQYLELLDMIQGKVNPASTEADRLFFLPDVSSTDLSQLQTKDRDVNLSQKTGAFLEETKPKARPFLSGKLVWKFHQGFREEGETENYLLCEVRNRERMIWRIEADHESKSSEAILDNGSLRVRKRFVRFLLPQYSGEVTLGNFDKRIGLGLNVGYHPLLGYTESSDSESKDTFLYPAFGRYNGFCGEAQLSRLAVLAFYSKNKRADIRNEIGTLDLSLVNRLGRAGFCFSRGELENAANSGTFKDDCGSLHLDLSFESLELSGEYARLSNGRSALAIDLHSSRKRYSFDCSWWRYEDDFIHPHGGGISNPDYETIYLEEIDYNYRARQAGERGVFFKSKYRLFDRFSLNFSHSQWRERSYLPDKMKLRTGAGYRFSSRLSVAVYQLWTDYDVEDEEIDRRTSSLDVSFSPHRRLVFNCISNYRSTEAKEYGDLRLKARTRLLSPFDFVLWLKYCDLNFSQSSDEYFSFHLQEKVRFFENYFVSAEFIANFYQDGSKTDTRAARIRVEASW